MKQLIKKKTAIGFGAAIASVSVSADLMAQMNIELFGVGPDDRLELALGGNQPLEFVNAAGNAVFADSPANFDREVLGQTQVLQFNPNSGFNIGFVASTAPNVSVADFATLTGSQIANGITVSFNSSIFAGDFGVLVSDGSTTGFFTLEIDSSGFVSIASTTAAAVPEPSSATGLALLAIGAAGIRRRREKS